MRIAFSAWMILVAAGCRGGEPDDLYYVLGRTVDVRGQPIAQQSVSLLSTAGAYSCAPLMSEAASPVLETVLHPFQATVADDGGAFLFRFYRFEAEVRAGAPSCFRVEMDGGPDGPLTRVQFIPESTDLRFPNVTGWDGVAVDARPTSAGVELSLSTLEAPVIPTPGALTGDTGQVPLSALEWQLVSGEFPAWRVPLGASPYVLDAYLSEDFVAPRVAVAALSRELVEGVLFGLPTVVEAMSRSTLVPVALGTAIPVSRGATCTWSGRAVSPCPLTDGRLELVADPAQYAGPENGAVLLSISLENPAQPRRVIIRDLRTTQDGATPAPLRVEGSTDGLNWTALAEVPAEDQTVLAIQEGLYLNVPLLLSAPVRHFRISAQEGRLIRVLAVREVSFFE